jgi:hypothetical protein
MRAAPQRGTVDEPPAHGMGLPIKIAKRQIFCEAHVPHAGILERFFRQTIDFMTHNLFAGRLKWHALYQDFACYRLALSGQDLNQFSLSIARYTGNPHDFT